MHRKRSAAVFGTTGVIALSLAGGSAAAPSPESDFGQHVAMCAEENLGQRANEPEITCTHDGMTMTFPTFGAMVQHMQEMHS